MNLGNNIKYFRNQRKMTQEELAELLGTTSKSVSRWEQSLTFPDITLLPYIANIFEITVDELLGVESIKQDEYLKELKKKAYDYQKNNDYNSELKLWQEAQKKLPNNEEIKNCLISVMNTINIITNELKYSNEIIKLGESILDKSTNNIIRLNATQCLVELYSQMGNIEMSQNYSKQLPTNFFLTYDVMKTRYLKGEELQLAIQRNIGEFVDEINRESEFIIYNNRITNSNEFKKEYLERLLKINELVFVKDGDYGYNSVPILFNYIEIIKLEISTTNNQNKVLEYLNEIIKVINYIINFKPHIIKFPLVNKIKCEHIGSYSNMILNLKQNLLKELESKIFKDYEKHNEYNDIIRKVNTMK